MDVVRITELQPKTYVEQGDYIAIDNQSDGTKKVQFTNLLDDTLSQENKIAPANVVGDEIATIRAAVGSPLKASTVAQMTDTNKIYVYVGSESGYTNGNWYYWNGSAWVSGGVYNSVAVVTDPTLTLSGVPADAKATGDEVTNLKSELTVEKEADWINGFYGATQGLIDVTQNTAICTPEFIDANVIKAYCNEGYKMRLQAFNSRTYAGVWNGTAFVTSNPNYYMTDIDIASFNKSYPQYSFMLVLYRTDASNITVTEGSNVKYVYPIDYFDRHEYEKGARTYNGINVAPRKHGVRYTTINKTLPKSPSGTTARQGIDVYDGKIFTLSSNNKLTIIDLQTITRLSDIDITSAHGNSCQFANTIESGEIYPRLYCFGYTDNNVYLNAITDNSTSLIKTYTLPITGYRLSGGYDADRNVFKTIHYKKNSSTDRNENGCILSVWDLNSVTEDSETGSFIPTLVSETEVPFVGIIQDCKCFGGWLYVLSGGGTNIPNYEKSILTVYDDVSQINQVVLVGTGAEPEGLAIVEGNHGIKVYETSNRVRMFEFSY